MTEGREQLPHANHSGGYFVGSKQLIRHAIISEALPSSELCGRHCCCVCHSLFLSIEPFGFSVCYFFVKQFPSMAEEEHWE